MLHVLLFTKTLDRSHKPVLKKMKLLSGEAKGKFEVLNPKCLEQTHNCVSAVWRFFTFLICSLENAFTPNNN